MLRVIHIPYKKAMFSAGSLRRIGAFIFLLLFCSVFHLKASTQELERIMNVLSRQSGLPLPETMNIRFGSPEQIETVFFTDFLKQHPAELLRRESHFLRLIGVFRKENDIESQLRTIARGNVKAYYQRESQTLYVDSSIPFEDDYSMGPVIGEIRIAMCQPFRKVQDSRIPFFSDANWLSFSLLSGDASFVMHRHFGEDPSILASMDGMSLVTRNPLVSSAVSFQQEPLYGLFYSSGLIGGVGYANRVFQKKDWKALNEAVKRPPSDVLTFLVEKPEKGMILRSLPVPKQLEGFGKPEIFHPGLFLMGAVMERRPFNVLVDLGWRGDICTVVREDAGAGELARWLSHWQDAQKAYDAFLILRNGFERRYRCRFVKGSRQGKSFLAGRDDGGFYVFLRQDNTQVLFVRSSDRRAINRFIDMAQF